MLRLIFGVGVIFIKPSFPGEHPMLHSHSPKIIRFPLHTTCLPYYLHNDTDKISSRLLKRKGIKTIFKLAGKLSQHFILIKDKQDLMHISVIYCKPCECDKVYIWMNTPSVETRVNEHQNDLRLWTVIRRPQAIPSQH